MKHLVLASGLSGTGKTEISKYLESICGFYRVCPGELRDEYIRRGEYIGLHFLAIYGLVTEKALDDAKKEFYNGRNVVIESRATNNKRRHRLLDPFGDDAVKKSIIIVKSSPDVVIERMVEVLKRNNKYDGDDEKLRSILQDFPESWEEPDLNEVEVLTYTNETQSDLVKIKRDLRSRFGSL
jgi:predicted kinase